MDDRQTIPLTSLDPAPWNPKRPIQGVYRDGLTESLDHFGLRDDLKVWPNPAEPGRYFVLDGNQRLDLLRERGQIEADCRVLADLDDEDARLFTAAFDRNHAVYDEARLLELGSSLKTKAAELRARLLRISPVDLERGLPAAGQPVRPEPTAEPPALTVPMLFMLTKEGFDAVKDGIGKARTQISREGRLTAAIAGLADRELDDLAVETALRVAHAKAAKGPRPDETQ